MRAGAYAAGLARRQGSRMVAVYVATTGGLAAGMAATAGALMQAQDSIATELEAEVLAAARGLAVDASFVRRQGNPYLELVAVADALRVDAIVIGASTRAGHRLVGSLAARLVRDARWPVTVVP